MTKEKLKELKDKMNAADAAYDAAYADESHWVKEYETDSNYPADFSCIDYDDVDSDQIGGKLARQTLAEIKGEK